MTRSHDTLTKSQFGPRAASYVTSAVHASGMDLDALDTIVRDLRPARALDLGCGGGHVAYRLAAHAQEVVACDLSAEMLAAVASTAQARGLVNIKTCESPAERLPFEDGAFDLVACRFSAHHWRDLRAGIAEAHRVVKRGAAAIFIDAISTGRAILDTHLQSMELLRDTSHVRDYSVAEWTATAEGAGFTITTVRRHRLRMDFQLWVERMNTPEPLVTAIRALQSAASREVREHFQIELDGSFMLDVMMLEALA